MKQKCSSIFTIMRCGLKAKMIMLLIAIITIFGTGLVYAGTTTRDVTISVGIRDTWPPAPVTNLSALAGSQEGEVLLSWTAPYEDDEFSSGAVQGYDIEYDTFSISDLGGDTTAWWNTAGGWKGITFANDPGQTEQTMIDSLWPGTTFYFAIKSYDDASPPNESPIDTRAASVTNQAYCVVPDTAPATPTGLTAIAGVEKVDLSWTELTESEKGIDFDYYKIYRSSISPSALFAVGTTTSTAYSDTGLQTKTSYYYAISAVDKPPLVLESPLSDTVTVWVVLGDTTAPAAVTDLFAETWAGQGEIRLTWTAPGDDDWNNPINGGQYNIQFSSNYTVSWSTADAQIKNLSYAVNPGDPQSRIVDQTDGLVPGTTYYFRLWTADEASNWSGLSNGATAWAQALVDAPPAAPTGLVAKAGNKRVTLTWTPNTEPDMKSYWVYRSTISGSYDVAIATVTHPTTRYVDTELTNEVIYYYVLKAVDQANNVSDASYEVSARPSLRPREPCGVKGTLVDGGEHIKIDWKEVTRNEDGSPCTDLEEYRVYRSTSLAGFNVDPATTVAKSILTWTETENIIGETYYYKVRAVDSKGVESGDSMMLMVQDEEVNVIALAEDMQARVIIPEELTDILYEESSSYGDDLNITVEEVPEEENKDKVISCYEYKAFRGYGNETPEEIESFSFAKPKASVGLSYEVNGQGTVKGTNIKASQAGRNLALFWFNGIEWVKLGARVDTDEQVITIKMKKLGRYKIKQAPAATEFSLNKVYPRIFTPNNDGLNDVVNFEYANPNEKGIVCRIFDIRGALVRQLDIGQSETSFAWDGKDEKGKVAPSGVYIYQLEGEGKVINGTVILAK
ncbi:MAG TPA: T9SS type B sorting domain-containing protein [bacterium]|nr:T9SS type B sorting domain-containing protein [bacterium]